MGNILDIIYADDKFSRIRFYLQEVGISTLEELAMFNFDELLFVPGVSEANRNAAKEIFSHFQNSSIAISGNRNLPLTSKTSTLEDIKTVDLQDDKKIESKAMKDALIIDVYSRVPRSAPFIRACLSSGKKLMSQLTDSDFQTVACIRGIGMHSAEMLKSVYTEFYASPNNHAIVQQDADNSVGLSGLPLSVRAVNCLKRANINSLTELQLLNENDLLSIKNIGTKTCSEILEYLNSNSFSGVDINRTYRLEHIDDANKQIPLELLKNIGVRSDWIETLLKQGLQVVNDLCARDLSPQEYALLKPTFNFLSISVMNHFEKDFNLLNDRAKKCLIMRCNGATLQEIGGEIGVTRERARQIIVKSCRRLLKSANLVAGMLFSSNNSIFTHSNLHEVFHDKQVAQLCKLVMLESEYAVHFNFSDKFVRTTVCPPDIDQLLMDFVRENIGDGLNFFDSLESIESELARLSIDFFDFEDIMNYLVHNKYYFYGDYVTKGKQSYALVCHDAIKKFFAFDIKLDSDENNEDMRRLRQVIAKYYQGVSIPLANRALTAAITRDASKMVLSGRGRYCPHEKAIYSVSLFDEICQFIHNSKQTTFYYSELYSHFEGRLLAETNINNFNFLHGMLKCLFPNGFKYERDMLVKNNSIRQDVYHRLCHLFKQRGQAIKKSEIRKTIPGINDFVFAFTVMRMPEIIQWDYNEFNHVKNIIISDEDKVTIRQIIEDHCDKNLGYCSESLLYESAKEKCYEFLEKNFVKNTRNLYYIANYLCGDEYRFRRPHIVSKNFPIAELSIVNIARVLLRKESTLNYEEYNSLAKVLGWASSTLHAVFSELEKDYIRITENDYEHKDSFSLSSEIIDSVSSILSSMIEPSGYYALSSIFDYEMFPNFKYVWNGFLLESIIVEYISGFRIVHPQIRDRRYQRGVIIPGNSSCASFEDFVIDVLKKSNIRSISESELEKFLRMRGIITSALPHELYESTKMLFKKETFFIN